MHTDAHILGYLYATIMKPRGQPGLAFTMVKPFSGGRATRSFLVPYVVVSDLINTKERASQGTKFQVFSRVVGVIPERCQRI